MAWGTSSGGGKSWLTTALCRAAKKRGIDVAPYKAQNMSNNARVVPGINGGYGEIVAAQYFQALAAGVTPTVDMNPVLLKPERDTASQEVLLGRVNTALSSMRWRERSALLAVSARESFERLTTRHELILIGGAGSPAEINLAASDYVNLGTARWAQSHSKLSSLLVTDIDRGGAFAHLYGRWRVLPDDLRPSLAGFVLNKFRGDAALLAPGPEQLRALTGVPLAGVIPMRRDHGLPEEDGVFDNRTAPHHQADTKPLRVAIIAPPHISNLDEFQPLKNVPGLQLIWARTAGELDHVDWIILPGSQQVSGDLRWLRTQGLDRAIIEHARRGGAILGVCGGLQMLGDRLSDPHGHDGEAGEMQGLGLLPLTTHFQAEKRVSPVTAHFSHTHGAWTALNAVTANGYEIHQGITTARGNAQQLSTVLHDQRGEPLGWQSGNALGVYAHGLFESTAVTHALFGPTTRTLDTAFETLADMIETHFESGLLHSLFDVVKP